jgi:chemotaxis protein CheD
MAETEGSLPEVYVQPGEVHLVKKPVIMRTLLGSCVGITFWAPRLGCAALCHPMLPHCPAKAEKMGSSTTRRYVDFAIRDVARQFDSLGVPRGEIQVKLFGGCDVLPVPKGSSRPTVGRLNYEAALRVLEKEGFAVSASCLGGNCGVTILFKTDTGEVLLKRLC